MSIEEEIVNKATDELAKNNCASIVIAAPFFGDDIYYRIKTDHDARFEEMDMDNLINAAEEVLRILYDIKKKNGVSNG